MEWERLIFGYKQIAFSHYMVFHRSRIKTKSSEISIRDNKISRVPSAKF